MKRVGITQRVEIIAAYGERRDCLDQQWHRLADEVGIELLPLPNHLPYAKNIATDLSGLILSGGNSPVDYATDVEVAPERDAFEARMIEEMTMLGLPVLGVCRGMQFLNVHYGGTLCDVVDHVAVRHPLFMASDLKNFPYQFPGEVNSFHNLGIRPCDIASEFSIAAVDKEGYVEAFQHLEANILGIMWHPERDSQLEDRQLLQDYFL